MCGLIGWVGNDPTKFNYAKFHALGVQNEERGRHSCGVSLDNEIWVGVDGEKLFRNFSPTIHQMLTEVPMHNPVAIGHTRWASISGSGHTAENAHPFGFGGGSKDGYDLCGAHNGTLLDYKELAAKYNIPIEAKNADGSKRDKIDSEILLEIIWKEGYKVLSDYYGAAALVWYDSKNPDTMYAFHGKSPATTHTYHKTEERPLYWLQEEDGSLYVSSLKESLNVINDTGGEIDEFDHNTVYIIKGGDIKNAKKVLVDRKDRFQKGSVSKKVNTTSGTGDGGRSKFDRKNQNTPSKTNSKATQTPKEKEEEEKKGQKIIRPVEVVDLSTEKGRGKLSEFQSRVYYNRTRYWRGETVLNGVYAPLKHSPMGFLGINGDVARYNYDKFVDSSIITEEPLLFFFVDGVLLDTELDFKMAIDETQNKRDFNSLCHMSRYPIIDITKPGSNPKAYIGGKFADDFVYPVLSKKVYTFIEGQCVDAHTVQEDEDFTFAYNKKDEAIMKKIKPELFLKKSEKTDLEDNQVIQTSKEELLVTVDECITDIAENVVSVEKKNEAISTFDTIKDSIGKFFDKLCQ